MTGAMPAWNTLQLTILFDDSRESSSQYANRANKTALILNMSLAIL